MWLKALVSCCGFGVNFVPLTANSFTGCASRGKYTLFLLSPLKGMPQLLDHALNGSFQIIVELRISSSPFPLLIFASHKIKCWDFIFQCTFPFFLLHHGPPPLVIIMEVAWPYQAHGFAINDSHMPCVVIESIFVCVMCLHELKTVQSKSRNEKALGSICICKCNSF